MVLNLKRLYYAQKSDRKIYYRNVCVQRPHFNVEKPGVVHFYLTEIQVPGINRHSLTRVAITIIMQL